jgi:hypothetical protein
MLTQFQQAKSFLTLARPRPALTALCLLYLPILMLLDGVPCEFGVQMQLAAAVDSSAAAAISTAAADASSSTSSSCCNPGTPLLFRDFCELLVRLAAARYPLLPSLEMQLQQVISYHLLPLLGGSARQLASGARSSIIAAPAAAALGAACGSYDASGGCEQQLRHPAVVQYLQDHAGLLQQLYTAVQAAAGHVVTDGETQPDCITQQPQPTGQETESAASADTASNATAVDGVGTSQGSSGRPAHKHITVQQLVACLQERGVLDQMQLSEAAAAACLLHNTLAVSDPQGARYATVKALFHLHSASRRTLLTRSVVVLTLSMHWQLWSASIFTYGTLYAR